MANRALLVGINDYKQVNDLSGCLNDITNIRNILKTYYGFTNNDIRLLADNRATKANIMKRLGWLVSNAKKGDKLIFHFSGHGSQIRDRDGDELNDNMDELICPWDMDWDGTFITDDDLKEMFKNLKAGVLLEVILDCCHSGSGTRELGLERPSEFGPITNNINIRFLPPPVDIISRFEGEEDNLKPTRGFKTKDASTLAHVLWAGCKDSQTSADAYIGDSYNGAFTFYFCKAIRAANGKITRKELNARVKNSLRYNQYSQVPQLECDNNRQSVNFLS